MATELETVLQGLNDHAILGATTEGPCITAMTRETFASASDATTAAEELLGHVLEQGYRLGGGLIGAERAERSVGAQQWRGELVEVLLSKASA